MRGGAEVCKAGAAWFSNLGAASHPTLRATFSPSLRQAQEGRRKGFPMYVWLRLARTAPAAKRRGRYRMGEESRLTFRCLPTDIDSNIHLNNARYMMLADLGRIDIFLRAGLLGLARKNGWAPIMGGLQSVYVREIRLWRRFDVV